MAWNIISKLAGIPVEKITKQAGDAVSSVCDRIGWTKLFLSGCEEER